MMRSTERILTTFVGSLARPADLGGDCDFSSFASAEPEIHPTVVWAKFQAMAEGTRLASEQLWGRRGR